MTSIGSEEAKGGISSVVGTESAIQTFVARPLVEQCMDYYASREGSPCLVTWPMTRLDQKEERASSKNG